MSDVDIQLPDGKTLSLHFDGKAPPPEILDGIVSQHIKEHTPKKSQVSPAQSAKPADPTLSPAVPLKPVSGQAGGTSGASRDTDGGFMSDPAAYMYGLAEDQGVNGLNSLVPGTDAPGFMGNLQRGAKTGLGLLDTIPSTAYSMLGQTFDSQTALLSRLVGSTSRDAEKRGLEKLHETALGAVPFSQSVQSLVSGLGTGAAAGELPDWHPMKGELEQQSQFQLDDSFDQAREMWEKNPVEFMLNAVPVAEGLKGLARGARSPKRTSAPVTETGKLQVPAKWKPVETATATEVPVKGTSQPRTAPPKRRPIGSSAPLKVTSEAAIEKPRKPVPAKAVTADNKPSPALYAEGDIVEFRTGEHDYKSNTPETRKGTVSSVSSSGTIKLKVEGEAEGTYRKVYPGQVVGKVDAPAVTDAPVVTEVPMGDGKTLVMEVAKEGSVTEAEAARAKELSGGNLTPKVEEATVIPEKKPRKPRVKKEVVAPGELILAPESEPVSQPVATPSPAPIGAGEIPHVKQAEATKPATIPGTTVTYEQQSAFRKNRQRIKEIDELPKAEYDKLDQGERDLYESYHRALDEALPLSEAEASLLNRKASEAGKKANYKEGQVSLNARYELDKDRAARTQAAEEVKQKAVSDKSGDYETYRRIRELQDDAENRFEDDTSKFPDEINNAFDDYVAKHYDKFEGKYDPESAEPRPADVFERVEKEASNSDPVVRQPRGITVERYRKMKDDMAQSGYVPNEKARKFLENVETNHPRIAREYEESRAGGVPTDPALLGYDPAVHAEWSESLRAKPSVKTKGEGSGYEVGDTEGGNAKAVTLSKERQEFALRDARAVKDAGLLDPEERAYLHSLPAQEKAAIEAARQRSKLTPLFEYGEGGDAIVPAKPGFIERVSAKLDEAEAASTERIASNKKRINRQLKGVDPKQAGAVDGIALADIARHVAIKIANKSIKSYEQAAKFIEEKYGKEARRYHRNIYDRAKEYLATEDETVLPQGVLRNRKGEKVNEKGEVIPEPENVTNNAGVTRPGDTAPLPVSKERFDKVVSRQAPGSKTRKVTASKRTTVIRVPSNLNDASSQYVRKIIRGFNQHKAAYENEYLPNKKEILKEKAQLIEAINNRTDIDYKRKQELRKEALQGRVGEPTVKTLQQIGITPEGIRILRERIEKAGLRSFDLVRAVDAFDAMTEGRLIRPNQRALLGEIYGKEFVGVMSDNRNLLQKNWDRYKDFRRITTALMFSADRGSLFRNARQVTNRKLLTDPKSVAQVTAKMFSASSDIPGVTSKIGGGYRERYKEIQKEWTEHPDYQEAKDNGILFGGEDLPDAKYLYTEDGMPIRDIETEEIWSARQIIDDLAENAKTRLDIADTKKGTVSIPLSKPMQKGLQYMARAMQAAEYGHNTVLNIYRIELYTSRAKRLKDLGFTPEKNPEQFKEMTRSIMTETGRGEFNKFVEDAQGGRIRQVLHELQLAPRFRKSGWDMTIGTGRKAVQELARLHPKFEAGYERGLRLEAEAAKMPESTPAEIAAKEQAILEAADVKYSSLPRAERVESLKSAAATATLTIGSMMAAKAMGADVDLDPFSPSFLKIVWPGGVVTDLAQQDRKPIQLFMQGIAKLHQGGNATLRGVQQRAGIQESKEVKYPSALDPAIAYIVNGMPPIPADVASALRGKNLSGQEGALAVSPVLPPLFLQDLASLGYAPATPAEKARNIGLGAANYLGGNTQYRPPKKRSGGSPLGKPFANR